MESKQEESEDNLQFLLQSHKLPDKYYNKLIEEGLGSIELLSQCTEPDVEQLCNQLALTLVDKLRLKQALQTINIPKEPIKYAVINQDEQMAILDIHQSIQKVENLIIQNNTNIANYCDELQDKLRAERNRVCTAFDSIHQMINERKESILNELEQNFQLQNTRTQQLIQYLSDANNTKARCQQLVLNKPHLNRNHTLVDLRNQCLSNLSKILQINPKINVMIHDDIQPIQQLIDNLVVVHTNNPRARTESAPLLPSLQTQQVFPESNNENVDSSNISSNSFGTFDSEATSLVHFKAAKKDPSKENERNLQVQQHTFKPLVALKEQNVETGHEKEELIGKFKVSKVYTFGRDVMGKQAWKLRAAQTELEIYRNSTMKTRLVCRECQTAKLRLNHFIPSPGIAKLNCKSDKLIIWAAYDVTMHDNDGNNTLSTFCAKFADAPTAVEFRSCFEKCQPLQR